MIDVSQKGKVKADSETKGRSYGYSQYVTRDTVGHRTPDDSVLLAKARVLDLMDHINKCEHVSVNDGLKEGDKVIYGMLDRKEAFLVTADMLTPKAKKDLGIKEETTPTGGA